MNFKRKSTDKVKDRSKQYVPMERWKLLAKKKKKIKQQKESRKINRG